MTTKEDIQKYVAQHTDRYKSGDPIFRIVLFENPDAPPGIGELNDMGFYYDLHNAIKAMHENRCDIRETCFNAGFILCHFQGLYETTTNQERMYFLWDDEKEGFYEAEEPEKFANLGF